MSNPPTSVSPIRTPPRPCNRYPPPYSSPPFRALSLRPLFRHPHRSINISFYLQPRPNRHRSVLFHSRRHRHLSFRLHSRRSLASPRPSVITHVTHDTQHANEQAPFPPSSRFTIFHRHPSRQRPPDPSAARSSQDSTPAVSLDSPRPSTTAVTPPATNPTQPDRQLSATNPTGN
jgi:hypothetical protein